MVPRCARSATLRYIWTLLMIIATIKRPPLEPPPPPKFKGGGCEKGLQGPQAYFLNTNI